jgi:hypothetical protein
MISFEVQNDDFLGSIGTSLIGGIHISYDELVERLGKPTSGPSVDGKVDAEWVIKFDNDVVATIYNWKTHGNPEQVTCWNIGGHCFAAVDHVYEIFGR